MFLPLTIAALLLEQGVGAGRSGTKSAIDTADLRVRVDVLAADSMLGRLKGGRGQFLASRYIGREFQRLGLTPAGEHGGYFQPVPLIEVAVDSGSWLAVGEIRARLRDDFLPLHAPSLGLMPAQLAGHRPVLDSVAAIDGAPVVFGGRIDDSTARLDPELVTGRIVLYDAGRSADGARAFHPPDDLLERDGLRGAAAIVVAELDLLSPNGRENFFRPWQTAPRESHGAGPAVVLVTGAWGEILLGGALEAARPGQIGARVAGRIAIVRRKPAYPARNVLAILPGNDPRLATSLVAVGGHSDGTGIGFRSYDHDSLHAAKWDAFRQRAAAGGIVLPAELPGGVGSGAAGRDSIFNGADDNASAVAALLEIAEAMATSGARPRRSILFFSSGAEEGGLFGAEYAVAHLNRPLDAYINMEMIGRGGRTPAGGRLSVRLSYSGVPPLELVAQADSANSGLGGLVDFVRAGDGCESDHAAFSAAGVPAISFQALGEPDYHEVTDEARYLDYDRLLMATRVARATVERVAGADADIPRPRRATIAAERCD